MGLRDSGSRWLHRPHQAPVTVESYAEDTYDRAWFRNAVEEHLDEAGVESDIDLS